MTAPDWWDNLYGPDDQPHAVPAETPRRWYTRNTNPAPEPPGLQVTIRPTTPATPVSPRKARIRWWVLRRSTAAGIGWGLGLGPAVSSQLDEAGPGAIGFALLLWLIAWRAATWLLRLVPRDAIQEVHDGADWAAHIPSATILLALALHTPGAIQ
ncbi:hypothetical protein ACN9M0_24850 [Streptomyces sp. R-07]|uniref:hypothetical protein n=1 Tax=Streptomyces sp. R-07 TaxID=3404052 RepID=UPI003CEE57EF